MPTEQPAADGSSPRQTKFSEPFPMYIDPEKSYQAEIVTNHGTMTAFLHANDAPKTVNNFVNLARYHYYDGIIFHRIIREFMIQGGDPEGSGRGGPGYKFEDELPAPGKYKIGSLAMANSGPDTNGSQFFVISGDAGVALPPSYSLFGKITEGLDTVEALDALGTAGGTPTETVTINSVTVTES